MIIVVEDQKTKKEFACKPEVAVRPMKGAGVAEDDDETPPDYLAPAVPPANKPPATKPKPGMPFPCTLNNVLNACDNYQCKMITVWM